MAELILEPQGIWFVVYGHRFTGRRRNTEMSSRLLSCPSKAWGDVSVLPVSSSGGMTQPPCPQFRAAATPDTHLEISRQQNMDVNTPQHERNPPHRLLLPRQSHTPKAVPEPRLVQPLQLLLWQLMGLPITAQLGPAHRSFQLHWGVLPFCLQLLWEHVNTLAKFILQCFCHMSTKEGQTWFSCEALLSAWPRTGHWLGSSLLKEHNSSPFISLLPRRHSPRCELSETRWFQTHLPALCYHHWASQEELLVKPHWVFPACQEERQVLGVASEGTVTAGVSQLCCWDPTHWRQRVELLGTVLEFIRHRLLSFRKGIFKKYKNNWTL